MRFRILLVVVSVSLLGLAPAPLPRPERHRVESDDVTGTWLFVVCEAGGRNDPEGMKQYRVEITKDKLTFHHQRGSKTEYDLRLYPEHSPPAFTWGRGGGVVYVGSYRLTRGELTMIFTNGSRVEDRPKDFNATPSYRYVYRRVGRG